jgi:hypothetical protein
MMATAQVFRRWTARWLRALVLLLLFASATCEAWAANVRATVDRNTVPLNEPLTFSIVLEGAQGAQPDLGEIPNFDIVERGSSFSADLARGISQQTFTYRLQPKQAGDFVIPAFQFNFGGEVKTTQPIAVKVVAPASAPWFAKIAMSKPQLYVGEVVEAELRVYFQEGRMTQFPQLQADPGFTVGKWPQPTQTRENISNQVYNVVVFKVPMRAVKGGLLSLGPANATVLIPERGARQDIFFGRPERGVSAVATQIMVQVLPVPTEHAPPTFAGAVGNFNLNVTAAPTNLAAGDPITLRVQVSGRGALDAVQLPPQPNWTEFKTYPPTSKVEGADANNLAGTKTFEQAVVPERAGIKALPHFEFSFFDPDHKAFRTLKGPEFALSVSPGSGGGSAIPSLPGATNASPAGPVSDLAHIKPYLGTITPPALLLTRPWFLGLQLAPPLVWLTLLLYRKRRERILNDPRLRRRAEVYYKVRDGLKELRGQADANDSEKFFATGLHLLQEQIGERIDAPPNAITEAVVAERLRPARAPEELCGAVQDLFQMCNLARYAPVKSSEELTALVPKFDVTLRALQQWEPAAS